MHYFDRNLQYLFRSEMMPFAHRRMAAETGADPRHMRRRRRFSLLGDPPRISIARILPP
jgi:hypothetical protein